VALRDIGLRDASDLEICSHAIEYDYIVVTKDEDFVTLVGRRHGPRILWVRIGNVVNRVLLAAFEAKWPEIVVHLESDNPVVVFR